MERKMFRLRVRSGIVLPFFAALGLTVVGGCGSSDSGGNTRKDANAEVNSSSRPEVNTPDGHAKTDIPLSIDLQFGEVTPQSDVSIDGPAGAEVPKGNDVAVEKTGILDAENDAPIGGDDAVNPGDGGPGTGGVGGSTAVTGTGGSTSGGGIGGSTDTGGTGGTVPTGGTGGSSGGQITGWPSTSLEAPYIFPTVTCNGAAQAAPAAYTFTLKNTGSTSTTFTGVSFSGAAGYTTDLTAGTSKIGPGESKLVTITAPAIPFTITPPATISAVLTLTTNETTGNLHTVFLAEEIHGARLAWGPGATATYIGGAAPGNAITENFTLLNTGDQPATVDLTSSYPSFTISTPTTAIEIPAGGSVTRTLTFTAPPQEGNYMTSISVVPPATSNLCAPVPAPWTATGMSLTGYPQFTPPGGEFAFTGFCGTTPPSRSITIKNVGTATLRWRPVLSLGEDCFTIVRPTLSGGLLELSVDTTDTIELAPKAIQANRTTECPGKLKVEFETATGPGSNEYVLKATPLGASIQAIQTELNFGTTNITSPATSVAAKALTFHNDGFADTVGNANTTVTITLSIAQTSPMHAPSYPPFIFEAQGDDLAGLVTHITLEANRGAHDKDKTVTVRYQRPEFGPYSGTPDNYHVTWTVAADKSCGGSSAKAADLVGQVTEGVVSYGFVDGNYASGDFGTAFCGAAPGPQDFYVTNVGTGPLVIGSAQLDTAYFAVSPVPTPSSPIVVAAGNSATFTITPQTIDGANVSASDLLPGSTKFRTNLTIATNAPATLGDPSTPKIITKQLTMHAKGIHIDSVTPTNWLYQQIGWPTSRSSDFTALVVNSGNVAAIASLATTIDKFALSGSASIAGGGGQTPLYSTFGPFNNCDTTNTTLNASGSLTFAADDGTGHALAGGLGVCQGTSVSLSLTGQVSQSGSMCSNGQRCESSTSQSHPDWAGKCVCDSDVTSCGGTGCCTQEGPSGTCVLYANQTPNKDPQHMGCGLSGAECAACDDYLGGALCDAGTCRCSGGKVYCGAPGSKKCISLGSDPDHCGDCGIVCSATNIANRTCTNNACDGTCSSGWANCDNSKQANGCNVHTDVDPDNCGACGTVCAGTNVANRTCTNHVCDGACSSGWANCNNTKQSNGCNVHTDADDNNCGSCGNTCAPGQRCSEGICKCDVTSCPTGCCGSNNVCHTPGTDIQACGTGGQVCDDCSAKSPGTWYCDQPTHSCLVAP